MRLREGVGPRPERYMVARHGSEMMPNAEANMNVCVITREMGCNVNMLFHRNTTVTMYPSL